MILSFDTETVRFGPRNMAPPLVCLAYAATGEAADLVKHPEAIDLFRYYYDADASFTGCALSYDFAVLCAHDPSIAPLVWDAYHDDRVTDVAIDQKLIDIAHGKYGVFRKGKKEFKGGPYSLAGIYHRYTGIVLPKETSLREGYGELIDVPLGEWTDEQRDYAIADAVAPVLIQEAQQPFLPLLEDRYRQSRADWWLRLMSVWGITTYPRKVFVFRQITERRIGEIVNEVTNAGLLRPNGSRNTKVAMVRMVKACQAREVKPRLTKTGKICLDKEACSESGDGILENYAEITSLKKVVSTDIPILESGIVHSHFEVIEDTGRTGSSKPNIQNVRRLPGIRECFIARKGKLFIDSDYNIVELRTWAQCCLWMVGHSRLAERLNEGFDPHLELGADLIGIDYAEALTRKRDKDVKGARQLAKGPNFGLPGGMGPGGLQRYIKKNYGLVVSIKESARLIDVWSNKWPESVDYFKFIRNNLRWKRNQDDDSITDVQHFVSNRYRGRLWYTKACNTFFQGLASDLAKAVGFELSRRCYDPAYAEQTGTLLYGARLVNFVHDQFIIEADRETAPEAALEVRQVMCEYSRPFLPDVPATCDPALCEFWSKDVEPVYDAVGRLLPWMPKKE